MKKMILVLPLLLITNASYCIKKRPEILVTFPSAEMLKAALQGRDVELDSLCTECNFFKSMENKQKSISEMIDILDLLFCGKKYKDIKEKNLILVQGLLQKERILSEENYQSIIGELVLWKRIPSNTFQTSTANAA